MSELRFCCRPGCSQLAVATLTYVYSDSTAVLGPLSTHCDPHTWDLCSNHTARFSAPRGWELVRSDLPSAKTVGNNRSLSVDDDDLTALAEAVRERGSVTGAAAQLLLSHTDTQPMLSPHPANALNPANSANQVPKKTARRGHLRLLPAIMSDSESESGPRT